MKIRSAIPIIAICNADDSVQRNNLTIRISDDEGNTWGRPIVVDRSDDPAGKKDHTACSDLVGPGRRRIGVLYEREGYKEIGLRW